MLRLNNIIKDYKVASGDVHALKGVSLSFRDHEFVSILGPSGCGKTTLLNIIGGLDKYTSGDLIIDGKSTKEYSDRDWDVYRNHRIGFVFQSYNLIPHQTVLGNVELALTISGVSKAERRERAAEALRKVGLGDQLHKKPNQLSGGQCQRVAIARALVNDPDIILADEPTGALDTKTSIQIMNLMREISGEKLIIMVTHNPEIAEEYSTRIVKLLDGKLLSDSNPYSAVVEKYETERKNTLSEQQQAAKDKADKKKTKMGFWTAFKLSGRNLAAKRARTIMVGFAGSIGIIGVAIVLAFSNGITNYINSMETDMLSGFPISISATALDFTSLTSLSDSVSTTKTEGRVYDKIYVNQVINTLTKLSSAVSTNIITKDYVDYVDAMPEDYYAVVTKQYGINFANNIYTDFTYDTQSAWNAADKTEWGSSVGANSYTEKTSITGIRAMYGKVLEHTEDYSQYASLITTVGTFSQLPNSEEYLVGEKGQYEIKAGSFPAEDDKNSLVLVLTADGEVNDMILAQFGYATQREFLNYAYYQADGENNDFYDKNTPMMGEDYPYSKFVGDSAKKFTWYPNNDVYKPNEANRNSDGIVTAYEYQTYATPEMTHGVDLKVACVLQPKSTVMYGALGGGLYYTSALTDYILEQEKEGASTVSEIVKYARYLKDGNGKNLEQANNIKYSFHYFYDDYTFEPEYETDPSTGEFILDPSGNKIVKKDAQGKTIYKTDDEAKIKDANGRHVIRRLLYGEEKNQDFGSNTSSGTSAMASTSAGSSMDFSTIAQFLPKEQFKNMVIQYFMTLGTDADSRLDAIAEMLVNTYYSTSNKVVTLRALGGDNLASSIRIYSSDFEQKLLLTDYLDQWNERDDISETEKIDYTDTLGLVMTLVNNLITMVTVALVSFTSVSLIVSTVMIGIITYVSVVERVKEIGIIRAMGGRKRDVKNLFNAETFIIGFLAGLIGIAVTYLVCFVFNIVIGSLSGIYTIADLTPLTAIIMVAISVGLTLISGFIPAAKAAKQDPVIALRTE